MSEQQKVVQGQENIDRSKVNILDDSQEIYEDVIIDISYLVPENSRNSINMSEIGYGMAVSSLAEYHIGEDWELYEERLDQFFVANSVPRERWVAVLITKIGSHAYRILRDLCDPVKPSQKTFEELCEILQKQFAPKVAADKERVEFYNLYQKQ